ncbi:biosynthetic-type acetolactate synthase large subunit [Caldicellulosiruptoraceae bacterium PP1]
MKLTGSEIIIECLKEQGVKEIFGYPGGAALNIYDSLYKHQDEIIHYLTSHEQHASHAADGYARASGKVGVVFTTSGPGATNIVTGLATAYMDSVPVVAITGQVATSLLGKDSFQEVDITGITMPITKHNFIVKDVNNLANTIRKAFDIARSGRPGPVLVDVCKDVTSALVDYDKIEIDTNKKQEIIISSKEDIEEAIEIINESQRPFICAGGGVISSEASEELLKFVETINAPIATTLMGLGGMPSLHPNYTGLVGMHGSRTSNYAVLNCDLLIAVGARFSDRVISRVDKFAPKAKIIHIDIDPAEIDKNVGSDIALVGDVKNILKILNESLNKKTNSEWINKIREWKKEYPLSYPNDGKLHPQYIIERISALTNNDAIITTEVGQNQIWAAQFYKYQRPRQFISSGGLGTMGYGFGAAIGAKIAKKDKIVIDVAGDGSFRMNSGELSTAVHYNIPVIIALMNNGVLGMVRQWQDLFYEKRFSQTTLNRPPDFVKLAEAYGALGIRVKTPEEVDTAIIKAIESGRPTIIDFVLDMDEKAFPIVPPGAPIDEIID